MTGTMQSPNGENTLPPVVSSQVETPGDFIDLYIDKDPGLNKPIHPDIRLRLEALVGARNSGKLTEIADTCTALARQTGKPSKIFFEILEKWDQGSKTTIDHFESSTSVQPEVKDLAKVDFDSAFESYDSSVRQRAISADSRRMSPIPVPSQLSLADKEKFLQEVILRGTNYRKIGKLYQQQELALRQNIKAQKSRQNLKSGGASPSAEGLSSSDNTKGIEPK